MPEQKTLKCIYIYIKYIRNVHHTTPMMQDERQVFVVFEKNQRYKGGCNDDVRATGTRDRKANRCQLLCFDLCSSLKHKSNSFFLLLSTGDHRNSMLLFFTHSVYLYLYFLALDVHVFFVRLHFQSFSLSLSLSFSFVFLRFSSQCRFFF